MRQGGGGEPPALPLGEAVLSLLHACFPALSRPVRKTLSLVTVAFLGLLRAPRGGNGTLSLLALSRVLPLRTTAHSKEKRLHRLLDNARLEPKGITEGLLRVVVGRRGVGFWPLLVDQTKSGAAQALVAGVPYAGRVMPLSVYTFEYPWLERTCGSQNALEEAFLCDLETAMPQSVVPVFVMDRGYARASLLRKSNALRRLYIIRGREGTRVRHGGRRLKLHDLKVRCGVAVRYRDVLYQDEEQVPVDVVVYWEPGQKSAWYLLVPPASEAVLGTGEVVALYRERMQVEHGFRDWKHQLGLRGLQLQQRIAPRTGRLLMAFCLAYALGVALGASALAEAARRSLERPRRKPRHGTRRVLSVLTMAMLLLWHGRWAQRARQELCRLVLAARRGSPLMRQAPPRLAAEAIAG
jgi:hypothetical protein